MGRKHAPQTARRRRSSSEERSGSAYSTGARVGPGSVTASLPSGTREEFTDEGHEERHELRCGGETVSCLGFDRGVHGGPAGRERREPRAMTPSVRCR